MYHNMRLLKRESSLVLVAGIIRVNNVRMRDNAKQSSNHLERRLLLTEADCLSVKLKRDTHQTLKPAQDAIRTLTRRRA